MARVLLVSMPFSSAKFPSMGLSALKGALLANSIACDVRYWNISYRNHVPDASIYDELCELWFPGDWVFGGELFGEEWARSERGGAQGIPTFFSDGKSTSRTQILMDALADLRKGAGSFLDACLDSISWAEYDVVGFTSVFSQQIASLALAARIKQRWPQMTIAFGGANCEGEMGQAVLSLFPFVDWVFSGDGDLSFPLAVQALEKGAPPAGIEGVAYRQEGRLVCQGSGCIMDMEVLPFPDQDDYYSALERHAPDLVETAPLCLEFSRGCWWGAKSQCTFCGLNLQSVKYRRKSHERALREIDYASSRYNTADLRLVDNNIPLDFFDSLLPSLGSRQNKLTSLFVETKSNLSRSQILSLKVAGAAYWQPGIESLDTAMLGYMKKGTTMLQTVRLLKWAREYGIRPGWNFLHSFPGEDAECYRRMETLVPLLTHLQPPESVTPVLLQRFSPLFNDRGEWGIREISASKAYRHLYPFGQEDIDRLAFRFDYQVEEGVMPAPGYLDGITQALIRWKDAWKTRESPLLFVERKTTETGILYDTRTVRKNARTELDRLQMLVLTACDSDRPFSGVVQEARMKMGADFPGVSTLRDCLEQLKSLGVVICEGDRYLSLANDGETIARYGTSKLVQMLYA